jgi:hypothetical protein
MSKPKTETERAIEEFEKEWEEFEKTGGYEGITLEDVKLDVELEKRGGKIMKGYKAGGKV